MPTPIKCTVKELFSNANSFAVPFYQREYKWEREKQIRTLEASFSMQKNGYGNNGEKLKDTHPIYLGALVLDAKGIGNFKEISGDYRIVDGQQRIVTITLLLCALRDIMSDNQLLNSDSKNIHEINRLLFSFIGNNKLKVIPNISDQDSIGKIIGYNEQGNFNRVLSNFSDYFKRDSDEFRSIKGNMPPRVLNAYTYFYKSIKEWIAESSDSLANNDINNHLSNYLKAILDAVIIAIILEENDDSQIVFQSLNSGVPLTAFELIKNDIFMRAEDKLGKGEGERLFKKHWLYFEESSESLFWKTDTSISKHKMPNSEWFMYYYLSAMTGADTVRVDRLVYEYKNCITDIKNHPNFKFSSVEEEIENLIKYAKNYLKMSNKSGQDHANINTKGTIEYYFNILRKFKSETQFYPFALRLWNSNISNNDRIAIFDSIISFMVRRVIYKTPTQGINKLFLDVIRNLDKQGWSYNNFVEIILDTTSESKLFPNNEQFKNAWLNNRAYGILDSQIIQFIFETIEMSMDTGKSEIIFDINSQNNNVEHFMPIKWHEKWPIFYENTQRPVTNDEYTQAQSYLTEDDTLHGLIRKRDRLLHNFGNLTILNNIVNKSIGNESYEEKKSLISNSTRLYLNKELMDNNKWNEDLIIERSKKLFERASKLWPHPRGL